jgi:hypothetical protein
VSPRAERIVHNVSQARDAQPGCINIFYHEASSDRRPRRTLRSHDCQRASRKLSAHAATLCSSYANHVPHFTAQALRAEAAQPWRTLRSHDHQRASRKLSVHAVALVSPCAHHIPHYTAQALRARGKRAVVLPHAFGLPAIVAGWTWCATSTASCGGSKNCDDTDAQPGASVAASADATSTATTTMHSPAAFHTAGVAATYATLARLSTRST